MVTVPTTSRSIEARKTSTFGASSRDGGRTRRVASCGIANALLSTRTFASAASEPTARATTTESFPCVSIGPIIANHEREVDDVDETKLGGRGLDSVPGIREDHRHERQIARDEGPARCREVATLACATAGDDVVQVRDALARQREGTARVRRELECFGVPKVREEALARQSTQDGFGQRLAHGHGW